ncbi:MAG: DUF3248 domain-containing protein [Trueperaceae bacterium]|nr:DUF3248 domain-containing protein [Trueperaceae bacterium]
MDEFHDTDRDERAAQVDGAGVDGAALDALAGQLVWRIGRVSDEGPVTVRVGLARSTPAFADLPRLRSASEGELEEALAQGRVRVEWVGGRGR